MQWQCDDCTSHNNNTNYGHFVIVKDHVKVAFESDYKYIRMHSIQFNNMLIIYFGKPKSVQMMGEQFLQL